MLAYLGKSAVSPFVRGHCRLPVCHGIEWEVYELEGQWADRLCSVYTCMQPQAKRKLGPSFKLGMIQEEFLKIRNISGRA